MTEQEVVTRLHEFNQQHAHINYVEDWSMVILLGLILVYIVVMELRDNWKANG